MSVISLTFILFFSSKHLSFVRLTNAYYLKPQTLNPYFAQMLLSFFLFHFWWCLSIREPKQSIDPFEVMSHQLLPPLFLQPYCECRLNDQKDEVGVQGVVWGFDYFECVLNNQIDF